MEVKGQLKMPFSDKYKSKNAIKNLIKRKDEKLEMSSIKIFPFINCSRVKLIAINRISIVNIGKNSLSIILDGNGNGFDFALLGAESEIETHLKSLLAAEEASKIDFQYV